MNIINAIIKDNIFNIEPVSPLLYPKNVVIDEALLISADYADTDDYPAKKFNNKVLDSIKESLNAK